MFPTGPAASWQGYAEADFIKIGPTRQGLVTALHVARGHRAVKGEPLFEQADSDDRVAVEPAERLVQRASDQLANLHNAAKPSEIAQAEANFRDAEAARDKIQDDLKRNQALSKSGAATVQIVDREEADPRSVNAEIAAAQAQVDQTRAPLGRPGEILARIAAVEAARAALARARPSCRCRRRRTFSCASSSCPRRNVRRRMSATRSRWSATAARPTINPGEPVVVEPKAGP